MGRYRTADLGFHQIGTTGGFELRALEQTRDPREQIASSKAAARAIGEFEGLTWCAGKHGVQKADREAILVLTSADGWTGRRFRCPTLEV